MGIEKLGRIVLVEKTIFQPMIYWMRMCRIKEGRTLAGGQWGLIKEFNKNNGVVRERIIDDTGSGTMLTASFFPDGKEKFYWKSIKGYTGGHYDMDWDEYKRWKREITGL
jgi:hypothetical protein